MTPCRIMAVLAAITVMTVGAQSMGLFLLACSDEDLVLKPNASVTLVGGSQWTIDAPAGDNAWSTFRFDDCVLAAPYVTVAMSWVHLVFHHSGSNGVNLIASHVAVDFLNESVVRGPVTLLASDSDSVTNLVVLSYLTITCQQSTFLLNGSSARMTGLHAMAFVTSSVGTKADIQNVTFTFLDSHFVATAWVNSVSSKLAALLCLPLVHSLEVHVVRSRVALTWLNLTSVSDLNGGCTFATIFLRESSNVHLRLYNVTVAAEYADVGYVVAVFNKNKLIQSRNVTIDCRSVNFSAVIGGPRQTATDEGSGSVQARRCAYGAYLYNTVGTTLQLVNVSIAVRALPSARLTTQSASTDEVVGQLASIWISLQVSIVIQSSALQLVHQRPAASESSGIIGVFQRLDCSAASFNRVNGADGSGVVVSDTHVACQFWDSLCPFARTVSLKGLPLDMASSVALVSVSVASLLSVNHTALTITNCTSSVEVDSRLPLCMGQTSSVSSLLGSFQFKSRALIILSTVSVMGSLVSLDDTFQNVPPFIIAGLQPLFDSSSSAATPCVNLTVIASHTAIDTTAGMDGALDLILYFDANLHTSMPVAVSPVVILGATIENSSWSLTVASCTLPLVSRGVVPLVLLSFAAMGPGNRFHIAGGRSPLEALHLCGEVAVTASTKALRAASAVVMLVESYQTKPGVAVDQRPRWSIEMFPPELPSGRREIFGEALVSVVVVPKSSATIEAQLLGPVSSEWSVATVEMATPQVGTMLRRRQAPQRPPIMKFFNDTRDASNTGTPLNVSAAVWSEGWMDASGAPWNRTSVRLACVHVDGIPVTAAKATLPPGMLPRGTVVVAGTCAVPWSETVEALDFGHRQPAASPSALRVLIAASYPFYQPVMGLGAVQVVQQLRRLASVCSSATDDAPLFLSGVMDNPLQLSMPGVAVDGLRFAAGAMVGNIVFVVLSSLATVVVFSASFGIRRCMTRSPPPTMDKRKPRSSAGRLLQSAVRHGWSEAGTHVSCFATSWFALLQPTAAASTALMTSADDALLACLGTAGLVIVSAPCAVWAKRIIWDWTLVNPPFPFALRRRFLRRGVEKEHDVCFERITRRAALLLTGPVETEWIVKSTASVENGRAYLPVMEPFKRYRVWYFAVDWMWEVSLGIITGVTWDGGDGACEWAAQTQLAILCLSLAVVVLLRPHREHRELVVTVLSQGLGIASISLSLAGRNNDAESVATAQGVAGLLLVAAYLLLKMVSVVTYFYELLASSPVGVGEEGIHARISGADFRKGTDSAGSKLNPFTLSDKASVGHHAVHQQLKLLIEMICGNCRPPGKAEDDLMAR